MSGTEEAVCFDCAGEQLLGIVSLPPGKPGALGVVVVVGGPQYRAGSHRMFVQLARRLATEGFAVLRFDVRGMGDSTGDAAGFEAQSDDIQAAIGALMQRVPQLRSVVLWGLCDGASAALLYLDEQNDRRVGGVCLVNPWAKSEAVEARAQVKHYYLDRLRQRDFWLKLLRGGVGPGALGELLQALRRARQPLRVEPLSYQARMLRGWNRRMPATLLVLSGRDYTAREFEEFAGSQPGWAAVLAAPGLVRVDIAGADHTFSDSADLHRLGVETSTFLHGVARGME